MKGAPEIWICAMVMGCNCGSSTPPGSASSGPIVEVPSGATASSTDDAPDQRETDQTRHIASGLYRTCVVGGDGRVRCWGGNKKERAPVTVPGLLSPTALTAGEYHACALLMDSTVRCWGAGNRSQLGNGSDEDSDEPVAVQGLSNAVAIGAGRAHTCAVLRAGTVWCWGRNGFRQLGSGVAADASSVPVRVRGLQGAVAVAGGEGHSCALLKDGTARCWGNNTYGSLGVRAAPVAGEVVSVTGVSDAVGISARDNHNCVVLRNGTVRCWGWNHEGQLGSGQSGLHAESSVPVAVTRLANVRSVSLGRHHSCALLNDGSAACWGSPAFGALGRPKTTNNRLAAPVNRLTGIAAITANLFYSCALKRDGSVWCWGRNYSGQLGAFEAEESHVPILINGV